MSTRLVVEIASNDMNPDIQIYDDDIKKLEVPSIDLIQPYYDIDSNGFQLNGEETASPKVGVEITEKNGTVTIGTKDGLAEMKFSAQILFESLLAKFNKSCRSLFDTEYGIGILKDLKEEYIRKSFRKKGRLYCDADFSFHGIGVVKSSGEALMVARTVCFSEDWRIIVDGLFGPVKLQDIVSPEITFFPGDGKKILIDNIRNVASTTIPEKVDSLCRMYGTVHVMEKDEPDIPLDVSLEGEAFEEAALRYLSSQRRKTQTDFDDLMLD